MNSLPGPSHRFPPPVRGSLIGSRRRASAAAAWALAACCGFLWVGAASAGEGGERRLSLPITSGSSFPPPPASPRWNSRTPLPPPPAWASPALLARFYTLVSRYGQVGMLGEANFSSWLILNGVTNPLMQAQFLELYKWYGRQVGFSAAGG